MGTLYLSVELAVDLLTCLVGCILVFKSGDNKPKFYWGCIAFLIGLVFAWENIEWLMIVFEKPEYRFMEMLNIEKMLKWYPLASIVALFPLASLFPGYLTPFKTLTFLLPSIILTTIGVCYLGFNGSLTLLASLGDVVANWEQLDVQLRCVIFVCSLATPLFFFLYPFARNKAQRRANRMMYVFVGFMLLFVCIYILFTLDINYFVFNLFGATAVAFALFFLSNIYSERIRFLCVSHLQILKRQLFPLLIYQFRNHCLYVFLIISSQTLVSYIRTIPSNIWPHLFKSQSRKFPRLLNRPVSVVSGNI